MPKNIQEELIIHEYLKNKGLNISLNGFDYLVKAIAYVNKYPCASRKEICEQVAIFYHTSSKNVSASMEYALRKEEKPLKNFLRSSSDDIRRQKNIF